MARWRIGKPNLGLIFILVFGSILPAMGQQTQVSTPDGTRHFIVLVDSSWSMVANSLPPSPTSTKRNALEAGEQELASLLYSPGKVVDGPWYRPKRDLISVVHYGIDSKARADLAYIRLKDAQLETDYSRLVEQANPKLSKGRFLKAIHPSQHTNLNVLAWALPLGLWTAKVSKTKSIQETFIILLNDMQMNDGSMVLEGHTLEMHLTPTVRNRLNRRRKVFNDSVRLIDKNGLPGVWLQRHFGDGSDLVAITILKALPSTTFVAAGELTKLHPIDDLKLHRGRSGLTASIASDKSLVGSHATLRLTTNRTTRSKGFVLQRQSEVNLGEVPGQDAKAYLLVDRTATNSLLGTQIYQVLYMQSILLPSGSLVQALASWLFWLSIVGGTFMWAYYHALLARHFQLLLPGYVTPFLLPPLSQRVHSRHTTRQPSGNGEKAAVLVLPSRFIRAIFYRNTILNWDARLRMPKLPASAESANLMLLPRCVEFIWQDRPPISGEFEISIERRLRNGRNQRAQTNVRFFALPRPASMPLGKS